ncbi:ulp1 protease family, C-terminal catalytic domain-containing protein, partial [Tanacetum coccineum]
SIDAKVDFKSKDGVTEDDIWVDNGKSIVPFDDFYILNSDSSLLETQSDENNTQSVDMQFDEITVQDDADKKNGERKKIQCDKGYMNEDLGFNFLSTGLEETEYFIPGFEKGLSNNKRIKLNTFDLLCMIDKQLENDIGVETSNNGIELVNDLTQILSPKVDISDMQIGLPGVVRNDGEISIESECFYGIKLNDVELNRKEYGIQQLATKSQEKRQQPKNVTFYERKVILQKALSKNEKKLAEFIWRACNDGSDIVFKSKDLQAELGIFKSLFPNVEVAAGILDIWSYVLNHEEKYREKNSGGGNIYCCSGMLSEHLIESGADLIRRRSIFESNITSVLSQSPYESFHDVDLVFFPMLTTKTSHHFYLICFNMKTAEIDIIDNLDNDVDDISVRYGELPIYLTKNTKDALEISIQ